MAFATARTIALNGTLGHLIDVQVDVSAGMVGTTVVGRPDVSLHEARDRCKMAVSNSLLDWPVTRRVTVLLSPADLVKRGTHFDLAIAVAVLAATDRQVPQAALAETVFIGELTLSGGLRPVVGVLPMVLAASARGVRRVFVPEPQAREAAMVPGMTVFGMRSLAQVVAELRGEQVPEAPPVVAPSGRSLLSWRGQERLDDVDLVDLSGMADPKYGVEVAAAGGHHLLLSGPKGSGKTSLAERIPTLLPDLTREEALELSAVLSLAGYLDSGGGPMLRPPFLAPHHTASKASILGGGSGRVHPGAVSRAHAGVLFLDEFPLLAADVIEALRQPLESGEITIARGDEVATFPAGGMVVLAANPCPCGGYHAHPSISACTCLEGQRRSYRNRLSGPITDRIDVVRHLTPLLPHERGDRLARPETSGQVRERIAAARARQAERYAGCDWRLNAQAPGPALSARWPLVGEGRSRLDRKLWENGLTHRGAVRVHRLAWTVADLRGADQPTLADVEMALALRAGDPLPSRRLEAV